MCLCRADLAWGFALLLLRQSFLWGARAIHWSGEEERFLTLSEYDAEQAASLQSTVEHGNEDADPGEALRSTRYGQVAASDVLVLVMASQSLQERAGRIEEAWAEIPLNRVFVVEDWLSTVPRERQWRAVPPSDSASVNLVHGRHDEISGGYWDAQTRQLDFMRMHADITSGPDGFKWVILADDDTWVHVARLLSFASGYDPMKPVLFSYILSNAHVLGYDYPCGGAGMLLSAAAYEAIAPRLLTQACPLMGFNDLTLGYCLHSQGIPVVHHPNMHCSPDVNRAMRLGENMLDLQRGISVHRLPGYDEFTSIVTTLNTFQGQLGALMERHCLLIARTEQDALDSRRFFWTAEALADAVAKCRAEAPVPQRGGPLHMEFVMFGRGVTAARYHKDRRMPKVTEPHQRSARWPDWFHQLQHLDCVQMGRDASRSGARDSWGARWLDTVPRVSRRQLAATDLGPLAIANGLSIAQVEESFIELEAQTPRGSWLDELRHAVKENKRRGSGHNHDRGSGRTWHFLDFAPRTTFVNIFETLQVLRSISDLYRSGAGEMSMYVEDTYSAVDLGGHAPPPLALAYEYFDLNIEQDAGVWLNGIAMERLLRCRHQGHPIILDPKAHANDWETEVERTALLWHNALAVDVFRTLRFCGVVLLHAPRMVPHALSYLPYSTYRRPHAPSVATALSIGNVMSPEQQFAMSQLVQKRSCQLRRRLRDTILKGGQCPARWAVPWRMRVLGGSSRLDFTERHWRLPGARFLGMSLVAFRSEHFLPDAQAARDGHM